MKVTATTELLAATAHEIWCDRLRRAGWRYGELFDEKKRTHDALVPFAQLSATDRRSTHATILALQIEEQLADAIEYPRGPDSEFTLPEMRVGLPVLWGEEPAIGHVVSWETDSDSDALKAIKVRWPDGMLSEHFPPERELRRVPMRLGE